MLYTLRFFCSKCSLFHNANLCGSCIIHILYTGCAKIKKKIRRQRVKSDEYVCHNADVARVTRIQHVIVNEVYQVGQAILLFRGSLL